MQLPIETLDKLTRICTAGGACGFGGYDGPCKGARYAADLSLTLLPTFTSDQIIIDDHPGQLRRQRPGRRAFGITLADFCGHARQNGMAYGPARYIENLTVIPNQVGALGLNLAADIRQQRIGQVVLEAAAVDGGIQAGADDRLPGHPLRHLAPVAVAQLRQFDVAWIERFARRVLSAFIWNTTSRENGSEEPFVWALDFRQS